jgi:ATP-binding protein involved in chromosome partitioning
VFGHEGGRREAAALGVTLLAEIPLVAELRASMDRGEPVVVADPSSLIAGAFGTIAAQVAAKLEAGHRPGAGAS